MIDEWSSFARLMANLIAKYASQLDLDSLPDLEIKSSVSSNFSCSCDDLEKSSSNIKHK